MDFFLQYLITKNKGYRDLLMFNITYLLDNIIVSCHHNVIIKFVIIDFCCNNSCDL